MTTPPRKVLTRGGLVRWQPERLDGRRLYVSALFGSKLWLESPTKPARPRVFRSYRLALWRSWAANRRLLRMPEMVHDGAVWRDIEEVQK